MIAFLFLSQNTRRSKRLDSLIEDTGNIHACGSGFSDTCVLLSVEVQYNIFILIVRPDLALFSVSDVNIDFVVLGVVCTTIKD